MYFYQTPEYHRAIVDVEDTDILKSLRYVRQSGERLIYRVRFPNQPCQYEDELILTLDREMRLSVRDIRTWADDGQIETKIVSVEKLTRNLPYMGSYDKAISLRFLACAQGFVEAE